MELSIKACPDCGALVMGDESVCSGCGKQLPVDAETSLPGARDRLAPAEMACPRCGMKVPKGVLRCRDCGTYMSPEVEAAALAQQAGRSYASGGSSGGLVGGGAGFGSTGYNQLRPPHPANSNFAEVADDADFDLVPELDLVDVNMRDIDEGRVRMHDQQTTGSGNEDDFELGDGSGAVDYGVASDAGTAAPAADEFAVADAPPIENGETGPAEGASNGAAVLGETGTAPPAPSVDHSVETGGDVLLDAALAEQREAEKRGKLGRRRNRRSAVTAAVGDRFLIYCPRGHRIQVLEKHRGRTGRCPNCKSLFFVPLAETIQTLGQAGGQSASDAAGAGLVGGDGTQPAPDAAAPRGYTRWITDVRLHRLNPSKLKLKAGSLEAEYETADLGACSEHLLVAVVFSGGGPFRSMQEPKKKPVTRQAMLDHLAANKPLAELPVLRNHPLTADLLTQLKIVQPSVPGEESMFADIPVFGLGRIAVRVPAADTASERAYLSFTLSQFRALSNTLSDVFGLADYGAGTPIPLTDDLAESTCHYSEAPIRSLALERLDYYRADPAIKLVVLGRRCEKCGLVVSEDSRKKEKIGGKTDASVAKAKCPKCKAAFGNISLLGVAGEPGTSVPRLLAADSVLREILRRNT